MNISHDSAMRIVTEMSSIIGHDVNMMDERGVIIASTDPERLGAFHGGARELLRQGLGELVVTCDGEYPGARQGINLPVCFEGATAGVIGITGRGEEVQQYSQIIKKMTEILLLDSWGERQKQLRAAMWSQFMEEWLFSAEELITDRFVERGLELGIDLRKPFQIFVVALEGSAATADEQERLGRVEEQIRAVVRASADGFYYKLPFRYVCFVSPASEEKLREMAGRIGENVARCGFRSFIGTAGTSAAPATAPAKRFGPRYGTANAALFMTASILRFSPAKCPSKRARTSSRIFFTAVRSAAAARLWTSCPSTFTATVPFKPSRKRFACTKTPCSTGCAASTS